MQKCSGLDVVVWWCEMKSGVAPVYQVSRAIPMSCSCTCINPSPSTRQQCTLRMFFHCKVLLQPLHMFALRACVVPLGLSQIDTCNAENHLQ